MDDSEKDELIDVKRNTILLLRSIYRGRPETCFFPYPACCKKIRNDRLVIDPEIVK